MIFQRIKNSSLFKSAFIYGVSSAINGAIPFLLLPVLTRFLNPADYGIVTVFTTLISFYNVFIGLNINGAVFNKYFFSSRKIDFNFGDYLFNCILILTIAYAINITLTLIFLTQIVEVTQLPPLWILIAASTPVFQYLILIRLAIHQAQNKVKNYALLLLFQSIINISLSLLFVILYNLSWAGRALGICAALYVVGFYSLYKLVKNYQLHFKWNKVYIREILKFGLPLVPHSLGTILIALADRLIITKLINLNEAGLYQAGLQISMVIIFFTEAFNKAYAPWLYSALQTDKIETKHKIVKFTYLYFIFIISIALLISIIPENLFVFIIGEKYRNSKIYISWSSLAFAFNGMYLMVCNYIFYSEKTKYLAFITLPVGILNVTLSYILIQKIGPVGAAVSIAISYLLMFILTWYVAAKLVTMPWGKYLTKKDIY